MMLCAIRLEVSIYQYCAGMFRDGTAVAEAERLSVPQIQLPVPAARITPPMPHSAGIPLRLRRLRMVLPHQPPLSPRRSMNNRA